jgi:hypothetical protein
MTIPADTFLSIDQAMKAFRPWISAELLKIQFRWLVAESIHPEERFTKPQLFNIMRAATGEFIELWGGSDPKTR